jgi:hypothetical protein
MSIQNIRSIVIDFTNDLTKVFPEYAFLWEKWLSADDAEYEKLNQHFMAVFPERFFDIVNCNMEIFNGETPLMFLPDVDFNLLFNCVGVSDGTKTSMWKYLQLLLFTVLGDMQDTTNFGKTLNMFESIDETELQTKMKETMEGLDDFFKDLSTKDLSTKDAADAGAKDAGTEDSDASAGAGAKDSGSTGFKLPKPEFIQEHMKILMEGKLGKLAKELTEEFTEDLKDVFDETTNEHSMKDIMAQFMKDPKKLMGIMKKITDKLQNKMQNGDISQDELMGEIGGLVEKFKQMGGGEDFIKNFTNGPFAKMFKNMAGGASMNQVAQMGKQSAMKERLRKKMEDKKMREALATQAFATQTTTAQASAQATSSQAFASQATTQATTSQASAQAPKTYVVKIGDEKQEKSNAMSEEELVKMFKSKKKDKKKK